MFLFSCGLPALPIPLWLVDTFTLVGLRLFTALVTFCVAHVVTFTRLVTVCARVYARCWLLRFGCYARLIPVVAGYTRFLPGCCLQLFGLRFHVCCSSHVARCYTVGLRFTRFTLRWLRLPLVIYGCSYGYGYGYRAHVWIVVAPV